MPTFPARIPLPQQAPVPLVRPASAVPEAKPAPTLGSTGEALTLDALMARQKEAALRQGQTMEQPVQNIPQGLGQLGWTLVNALQERRAEKDLAQGNADVANAFGQMDWNTGQLPQEAMATLMQRDPATGIEMYKTAMALRAAQAKQANWVSIPTPEGENGQWFKDTVSGQTKKEGGGADTGAWKPSDIGSLRDDYTKAAATYTTADPSWNSMKKSAALALNPDASIEGKGAADYDMIVGWAKLLDPQSVVREGEVQSASMTGGMIGQINGWLNTLRSKGSLDDATRRAIMTQGANRMGAYYTEAKTKRDWITGIATRHGVNPEDVVAPLADFTPWEEKPPDEQATPDEPVDPNAPLPVAPSWFNPEAWPTPEEWAALPPEKRATWIKLSKQKLTNAGGP